MSGNDTPDACLQGEGHTERDVNATQEAEVSDVRVGLQREEVERQEALKTEQEQRRALLKMDEERRERERLQRPHTARTEKEAAERLRTRTDEILGRARTGTPVRVTRVTEQSMRERQERERVIREDLRREKSALEERNRRYTGLTSSQGRVPSTVGCQSPGLGKSPGQVGTTTYDRQRALRTETPTDANVDSYTRPVQQHESAMPTSPLYNSIAQNPSASRTGVSTAQTRTPLVPSPTLGAGSSLNRGGQHTQPPMSTAAPMYRSTKGFWDTQSGRGQPVANPGTGLPPPPADSAPPPPQDPPAPPTHPHTEEALDPSLPSGDCNSQGLPTGYIAVRQSEYERLKERSAHWQTVAEGYQAEIKERAQGEHESPVPTPPLETVVKHPKTVKDWRASSKSLERQLKDANKKINKLKEGRCRRDREIAKLMEEVASLTQQKKDLDSNLKAARKEIKRLNGELQRALQTAGKNCEYVSIARELDLRLGTALDDNARLKEEVGSLRVGLAQCRADGQQLGDMLQQRRQDRESLKQELEAELSTRTNCLDEIDGVNPTSVQNAFAAQGLCGKV
ncbi:hypothetical protein KIPB_009553, partial [Kipferlia bialata]|eukprot:g9553.t1